VTKRGQVHQTQGERSSGGSSRYEGDKEKAYDRARRNTPISIIRPWMHSIQGETENLGCRRKVLQKRRQGRSRPQLGPISERKKGCVEGRGTVGVLSKIVVGRGCRVQYPRMGCREGTLDKGHGGENLVMGGLASRKGKDLTVPEIKVSKTAPEKNRRDPGRRKIRIEHHKRRGRGR